MGKVQLDEIRSAIREILIADWRDGANDYAFVRVSPDGSVCSGREPSYCLTVDEYEGKPPYTLTVWSRSGVRQPASIYDGIFEWEEVEGIKSWRVDCGRVFLLDSHGDLLDEVAGVFESDYKLYRLSDRLLEEPDLDDIMIGVDGRIAECDWLCKEI